MIKWLRVEWDRFAAWGCVGVGAVFLLVGWIGISGKALAPEQLPYILSGGIGGIFFLGLGATLLLSADLRDEWRKLDRIDEVLRTLALTRPEQTPPAPRPSRTRASR